MKPIPDPSAPAHALLDRDHSILAFNERVLSLSTRVDIPLLERLRYLCIVSSNLDEFFEVRAASHLVAAQREQTRGEFTRQSFERLAGSAHALVARQYATYNELVMPALDAAGIRVLPHGERDTVQRRWVASYFRKEVAPLLIPVCLDPSHPFPMVANKSLHFIVQLGGADAFGRSNEIAIVKVPRALPRVIPLPARVSGDKQGFVSLSSVIRAHLGDLFPGRPVGQFSQFRVTRHSDLAVDQDDVLNLRTALRQGLQHRHFGLAVRLEVSAGCSEPLSALLLRHFGLPELALYRVPGPVNLVRLTQLVDLAEAPHLCFPSYKATFPAQLSGGGSVFEQLRRADVMVHQPYESFSGVMSLLREAVRDPQVLVIKQTIYRTGSDPELLALLQEAVRAGKEVMVVVELKARFDEETNINWAEALESIGAQVVYGVVGLKTHAKMMLITRREGRMLRRYGHLSTGNYNPRTARLYTDVSQLTADPILTLDMEKVFAHLASHSRLPRLQRMWLAPFHLHRRLLGKIRQVASVSRSGAKVRIIAKMNALTDEALIRALVQAGQAGVTVDLIVRGACLLPAGVPGWTDNIRVRSVVGRLLEHSRLFYLRIDNHEELYLSSADWMSRNMIRRVELAWPVTAPASRTRLLDECLLTYLRDDADAWEMGQHGRYHHLGESHRKLVFSAQSELMRRHRDASGT
ncbi:MAG: polyphosphate kinase 1 [Rhodoferax sp.]|nr:polyphosphate kinase 1 [Rhodoferax sp.]